MVTHGIWEHVIEFCDSQTLCRLGRLSRRWRHLIDFGAEATWKRLLECHFFPMLTKSLKKRKSLPSLVSSSNIESNRLLYAVCDILASRNNLHFIQTKRTDGGKNRVGRENFDYSNILSSFLPLSHRLEIQPLGAATLETGSTSSLFSSQQHLRRNQRSSSGMIGQKRNTTIVVGQLFNSCRESTMLVRLKTTDPSVVTIRPFNLLLRPLQGGNVQFLFNTSRIQDWMLRKSVPPGKRPFEIVAQYISGSFSPPNTKMNLITAASRQWRHVDSSRTLKKHVVNRKFSLERGPVFSCDLAQKGWSKIFCGINDVRHPFTPISSLAFRIASSLEYQNWMGDRRMLHQRSKDSFKLFNSLSKKCPRRASQMLSYLPNADLARFCSVSRGVRQFMQTPACNLVWRAAYIRRYRIKLRVDECQNWYKLGCLSSRISFSRNLHLAQVDAMFKIMQREGRPSQRTRSLNLKMTMSPSKTLRTFHADCDAFVKPLIEDCKQDCPFCWAHLAHSTRQHIFTKNKQTMSPTTWRKLKFLSPSQNKIHSSVRSPSVVGERRTGQVTSMTTNLKMQPSSNYDLDYDSDDQRFNEGINDTVNDHSPISSVQLCSESQMSFIRMDVCLMMYNSHFSKSLKYKFRIPNPFQISLANPEGVLKPCEISRKRLSVKIPASIVGKSKGRNIILEVTHNLLEPKTKKLPFRARSKGGYTRARSPAQKQIVKVLIPCLRDVIMSEDWQATVPDATRQAF